jgi:hypothetical protein
MPDDYKEVASWFGAIAAAVLGALGFSRHKSHRRMKASADNGSHLAFDKFVDLYQQDQAEHRLNQAELTRHLGEIELNVRSMLRAVEATESKLLEVADLRERVKLVEMKLRRAEGC